jgi:hypothetical protein
VNASIILCIHSVSEGEKKQLENKSSEYCIHSIGEGEGKKNERANFRNGVFHQSFISDVSVVERTDETIHSGPALTAHGSLDLKQGIQTIHTRWLQLCVQDGVKMLGVSLQRIPLQHVECVVAFHRIEL